MAKGTQDIKRFLTPGSGTQISVPGEYIYCKRTGAPIRVWVGDTQAYVDMEAGDKLRLDAPFSQFRIQNIGDYPTQVALVVGWGDYWRQIIQGEVSVRPSIRGEDGELRPDTRHDLDLFFRPVYGKQSEEYSAGDTQLVATSSEDHQILTAAWDATLGRFFTAETHSSAHGHDFLINVRDADWQETENFNMPVMSVNGINERVWVSGVAVDKFGRLYVQSFNKDAPNAPNDGTVYRWAGGSFTDAKNWERWITPAASNFADSTGDISVEPDGSAIYVMERGFSNRTLHKFDADGNQLAKNTIDDNHENAIALYEGLLWVMWDGTGTDRVTAWSPDDLTTEGEVTTSYNFNTGALAATGDGFLAWAEIIDNLHNEVREFYLEDTTFGIFGEVNTSACAAAMGLYAPDESGENRTTADISLTHDKGRTTATGEIIKAALELWTGDPAPDDYLDHVYAIELPLDQTKVTAGYESFAAAGVADDFTATLPGRVILTVDSDL